MGLPKLPSEIKTKIDIDRQGIIDLLLVSIALEEIGLAHIINAEGELMQMYLSHHECKNKISKEDLLKLNRSVLDVMEILKEKEKILKEKLGYVIRFYEEQPCS